jgi:hypothetical protein
MERRIQCNELIWRARNQGDLGRYFADDTFHEDKALIDFMKKWIGRYIVTKTSNPVEKFIYLWVTFNAWGTLVVPDRTQNHMDTYLIHCIANDSRFQGRFNELLDENRFSQNSKELISYCPIIKVLWMRNKNIRAWDETTESRAEFIQRIHRNDPYDVNRNGRPVPAFAPSCSFGEHLDRNEPIPLDWPHTLHAIYQIRCNLFHGGKTYDSKQDRRFVKLAHSILWEMWWPEVPNSLKVKLDIRRRARRLNI